MIDEAAETGDLTTVDGRVVGVAREEAEGTYAPTGDGDLERTEPDEENCHLEVAVADAAGGRFVPEPTARATLSSNDGDEDVSPFEGPSIRHPGLHHHGKTSRWRATASTTSLSRSTRPSSRATTRRTGTATRRASR
ncbi:hypothetical protein BRD03_05735 [Halobacteriales archaeon QS_9_68_17]|nr:MAG: hypothetical protein BRD03_05735 [Halobacteriales archaeon QS_9_68_17]